MSDDLVKRLRAPTQLGQYKVLKHKAADLIERQHRIIAAHEQQVKDGAAVIAEKDAEIASFRETLRKERDAFLEVARLKDQYRDRAIAAESSRDALREKAREVVGPFSKAVLPFTLDGECTMVKADAVIAARRFMEELEK